MSYDLSFTFTPTDDLSDGQRWSTWHGVERLCRGPKPRPSWVVTDDAAIDTELGIVKTGKEADCFLLERAVPGNAERSSLLAAKRYRDSEHRSFQRSVTYTEGRRTRNSRDARALAKGTSHGRSVAAAQWAGAEWAILVQLWQLGVAVPYPVQIDGTEILMEFIEVDGSAAPRLSQVRPERDVLGGYFEQVVDAMDILARNGLAHGDLSPFNILAQGDRVVIIDLPQAVDIVGNPQGMNFLQRDVNNVCRWFVSRGLDVDSDEVFANLVGSAFGGA